MRRLMAPAVLVLAIALPGIGSAQVYRPTDPPRVTASGEDWVANRNPIYFNGFVYYPAGPTVFFNGDTMIPVGDFRDVPIYADTTVEPNSVVLIPVGGKLMRPYERRRSAELAGTEGSMAPSFPVQLAAEASSAEAQMPFPPPEPAAAPGAMVAQMSAPAQTSTAGTFSAQGTFTATPAETAIPFRPGVEPYAPTHVESIPRPTTNDGVWIHFQGRRWVIAGDAVVYEAAMFRQIGDYFGFPVYRRVTGADDQIYVPTVPGGALTPYRR